ncbi:MAG: hypothetical protein MOGMAGMI_02075 [Candidatus Omnitrophica bacterium]|nr:hypothetical protein [Candidatus Omnitrophota bacterium]
MMALGDSTTAGTPYFRGPLEAPPDGAGDPRGSYTYWVRQAHPEWTVHNHGVNAERTDQIRARVQRSELPAGTDTVIVLAGVNDLYQGRTPDQVLAELEATYRWLGERGARVVACTVLPYDRSTPSVRGRMTVLNEGIRRLASENGLLLCDTHGAAADPTRPGHLKGTPDGLHPDIPTARAVGEAIVRTLERA